MNVQEWKITVVQSNPQLIRHVQIASDTELSVIRKLIRCIFDLQKDVSGKIIPVTTESLQGWEQEVTKIQPPSGLVASSTEAVSSQEIPETVTLKELAQQSEIWQFQPGEKLHFSFRMELLGEQRMEMFTFPVVTRARGVNLPDQYCDSPLELNDILSNWENNYAYYSSWDGYVRKNEYVFKPDKTARSIRRMMDPSAVIREVQKDRTRPYAKMLNTLYLDDLRNMVRKLELDANPYKVKSEMIRDIQTGICDKEYLHWVFFSMSPEEYVNIDRALRDDKPFSVPFLETDYPFLWTLHMVEMTNNGNIRIAEEAAAYFQKLEDADGITHVTRLKYYELLKACLNLLLIFQKEDAKKIWVSCFPEEQESVFEELWDSEQELDFIDPEIAFITDDIAYNERIISAEAAELAADSRLLFVKACYVPGREELRNLAKGKIVADLTREALSRVLKTALRCTAWKAEYIAEQIGWIIHIGEEETELEAYLTDALRLKKNSRGYQQVMKVIGEHKNRVRKAPLRGFTEQEFQKIIRGEK